MLRGDVLRGDKQQISSARAAFWVKAFWAVWVLRAAFLGAGNQHMTTVMILTRGRAP
jgi:hypothetical protein